MSALKAQFKPGETWKVTRHDPRTEIYANDSQRVWPKQTTVEYRTVKKAATRSIVWTFNGKDRHTDWPSRAQIGELRDGYLTFAYETGVEMILERQSAQ